MRKVLRQTLACVAAVVSAASATAQDPLLEGLQRNIDIFSGVLEDALDFEEAKGLFGLSLGGIESTYLLGQGVVLEVRTPLANSRNRLSLASLNSAMQTLQVRGNPFESIALSQSTAQAQSASTQASPVMALRSQSAESASFYAQMMERVANVDYSLAINNAILQATESARSLRSLGSVDDGDYQELRADIEGLRAEMGEKMQGLRELEAQIRESTAQAIADSNIEEEMRLKLDTVMAQIEPLREQAVAKAAELRQRREQAEQAYTAQWQQDVVAFEDKLYQAMCDYGSTLRELPDDERVSIILTGLGEQGEDQRRTDKIHVFNKADLQECQADDISVATLRERSDHYSY
ncbi:MAG: hypothetical protein COB20_01945 [SAR86 cluster bacterium]|uniref:Uncharacterized protein n=1 Tax=SAR86 cluster bacterium TaxID=2030880 RepID=A0A2A4XFI6_9GAMM|nr:MAG: hypothetical protein COB20_01945 [SAR86 cluster bacterium]